MDELYYILSLKWSQAPTANGLFVWWAPKNQGYTWNLEQAGKYTKAQIDERPDYYNNGEDTLAIRIDDVADNMRTMLVVEQENKEWKFVRGMMKK